jgi:hypothetical protein
MATQRSAQKLSKEVDIDFDGGLGRDSRLIGREKVMSTFVC